MINYTDYLRLVKNPIEQTMSGFQTGQQIKQQIEAQQQLEQQKQEAAKMKQDISMLSSMKNPSASDYANIVAKYPVLAKSLKEPMEQMNQAQQEAKRKSALNVYAALDAGQTDFAKQILEREAIAAENSGLQQDADSARALLKVIEVSPESAKNSAGLFLSSTMGPDKFSETWTKLQSERRERELEPAKLKKQAAELGLTEAQTAKILKENEKLDTSTKIELLRLENMKDNTGKITDIEKKVDAEGKLRAEYFKNTANFRDTQEAYRRIEAAETSAAGDLSLIFSYMKMLDPASVVREGEFANAQNAGGISDKVRNIYNKLLSGERLTDSQRSSFKGQSKKLFNASAKREKEVRQGLSKVGKNYGLNLENIFITEPAKNIQEDNQTNTQNYIPSYMKYGVR